jgi:hypothetical protein
MDLDYWIELSPYKKRLVLVYLLQLKKFSHDEVKNQCPERIWIDKEQINAKEIPTYILKMNEAQLLGELTFCGGDPQWT